VNREALHKTAAEILRGFGATDIFLFGSVVEGTATADSDVDIAVAGLAAGDYFSALCALADALHARVDLLRLENLSPRMRAYILNTGQRIAA
jgi:predicted nucleotidyltransferase